MGKIQHIQYPVGQGGLHLGIIGDYAYIYDCGGYGDNVDWNGIFQHILEELRGCQNWIFLFRICMMIIAIN